MTSYVVKRIATRLWFGGVWIQATARQESRRSGRRLNDRRIFAASLDGGFCSSRRIPLTCARRQYAQKKIPTMSIFVNRLAKKNRHLLGSGIDLHVKTRRSVGERPEHEAMVCDRRFRCGLLTTRDVSSKVFDVGCRLARFRAVKNRGFHPMPLRRFACHLVALLMTKRVLPALLAVAGCTLVVNIAHKANQRSRLPSASSENGEFVEHFRIRSVSSEMQHRRRTLVPPIV